MSTKKSIRTKMVQMPCNKSRQPIFQKIKSEKIWVPHCIGLPVKRACLPQLESTRFL